MRGNREQITLTLPPETLNRLERLARDAAMTRGAAAPVHPSGPGGGSVMAPQIVNQTVA
jgi:hypothetical protein